MKLPALKRNQARIRVIVVCLAIGLALGVPGASSRAASECVSHYAGIEYCTADDGKTHVMTIDLTQQDLRFDIATASNAQGPNPPSWNSGLRQTVEQMAGAHPELDGLPLAVAINGDYGGGENAHGWDGFMVRQGKRLDGPSVNSPDCDCTAFDRSNLAISRSQPFRVDIARHSPAELNELQEYRSTCASSEAFKSCRERVLNRTPGEDEEERYRSALEDRWYTTVGGGPIIVENGQYVSISEGCRKEKFSAHEDWCQDEPNATPDRMVQLRMGTAAGVSADGKRLILIVTTARLPNALSQLLVERGAQTGIRLDGSESSQVLYKGEEKTGNTRRISNALLVYARPIEVDDAILAEPVWPVVTLPGEAFQSSIALRNEGTTTWSNASGYALVNVRNPLGAPDRLPLPHDVPPGEVATWTLEMSAPNTPGPHRSLWQLERDSKPVGPKIVFWVGVLPEKAREWKAELEQVIEEAKLKWEDAKRRGEREFDKLIQELIDELERRLLEIIQDVTREICPLAQLMTGGLVVVGVLLKRQHARR